MSLKNNGGKVSSFWLRLTHWLSQPSNKPRCRPARRLAGIENLEHRDLMAALVGTWTNPDVDTRGLTEIEITSDRAGYHVQAWGQCHPVDCDWGEVDLDVLGTAVTDNSAQYAIGSWDHGFKDTILTIDINDDELIADFYNVFKDGSGRSNYHQRYELTEAGDMIDVAGPGDDRLGEILIGGWVNSDEDTRGTTKLGISKSGGSLDVHGWGSCTPTDCDWGSVPMHVVGTSVSDDFPEYSAATWDFGFKTTFIATRVDGADLVVDSYHVFHDGSNRSNYHREERFWKVGDSNRDGLFDSSDLVDIFTVGEYEDNIAGNSTWEEGDWNRDGEFDSADLVMAFQCGGYDEGPIYARAQLLDPIQMLDEGLRDRKKLQAVDQVYQSENIMDFADSWAY
jgi:hypothetical protein